MSIHLMTDVFPLEKGLSQYAPADRRSAIKRYSPWSKISATLTAADDIGGSQIRALLDVRRTGGQFPWTRWYNQRTCPAFPGL